MNRSVALELAGNVLRACAGKRHVVQASPAEFEEAALLVEEIAEESEDAWDRKITEGLKARLRTAPLPEAALIASGFLIALANDPANPAHRRKNARRIGNELAKLARERESNE